MLFQGNSPLTFTIRTTCAKLLLQPCPDYRYSFVPVNSPEPPTAARFIRKTVKIPVTVFRYIPRQGGDFYRHPRVSEEGLPPPAIAWGWKIKPVCRPKSLTRRDPPCFQPLVLLITPLVGAPHATWPGSAHTPWQPLTPPLSPPPSCRTPYYGEP